METDFACCETRNVYRFVVSTDQWCGLTISKTNWKIELMFNDIRVYRTETTTRVDNANQCVIIDKDAALWKRPCQWRSIVITHGAKSQQAFQGWWLLLLHWQSRFDAFAEIAAWQSHWQPSFCDILSPSDQRFHKSYKLKCVHIWNCADESSHHRVSACYSLVGRDEKRQEHEVSNTRHTTT
jgi:hypothetical protein